jgi:hypothetical protein
MPPTSYYRRSMNLDPATKRSRFSALFRLLFGLTLLAVIIIWVAKQGILTERISVELLICSTFISLLVNFINASVIRTIVAIYQGKITYASSLRISCLGALGNAAGGLPIGTGLKFAILYKQSRLKVTEITAGLVIFSIAISFVLLAYASVSIWAMNFSPLIKSIPGLLFIVGIVLLIFLWKVLKNKNTAIRLVKPFLMDGNFQRLLVISFSMATVFILNYWIISRFLFPDIPSMQIVFVASVGILTGLGSLLQSVGGIQEISMGLAAYVSGASLIDGAQLALFLRITSLISSGLLLAIFYILPNRLSSPRRI